MAFDRLRFQRLLKTLPKRDAVSIRLLVIKTGGRPGRIERTPRGWKFLPVLDHGGNVLDTIFLGRTG